MRDSPQHRENMGVELTTALFLLLIEVARQKRSWLGFEYESQSVLRICR